MFRDLFSNTIRRQVLSLRFLIYLAGLTVLFIVNVVQYLYGTSNRDLDAELRNRNIGANTLTTQIVTIPPAPAQFIAAYNTNVLPRRLLVEMETVREVSGSERVVRASLGPVTVDWLFILGVWCSLGAILLSFDTVNGLKKTKVLSLMLAMSERRSVLFLARSTGIWVTVYVPFFVLSMLSTVVIMTVLKSQGIPVATEIGLRALTVQFPAMLYLASFVLLGKLISTMTELSVTSLLCLIGIWAFFVWLWPIFGFLAADQIQPLPSLREASQSWREQEVRGAAAVSTNQLSQIVGSDVSEDVKLRLIREEEQRLEDLLEQEQRLGQMEARRLKQEYAVAYRNQYETGLTIGKVSPFTHLTEIFGAVSASGWFRYRTFVDQSREFATDFALRARRRMEELDSLARYGSVATAAYGNYQMTIRGSKRFDHLDALLHQQATFQWREPTVSEQLVYCQWELVYLGVLVVAMVTVGLNRFESLDVT